MGFGFLLVVFSVVIVSALAAAEVAIVVYENMLFFSFKKNP
jgi:hypothetical protein